MNTMLMRWYMLCWTILLLLAGGLFWQTKSYSLVGLDDTSLIQDSLPFLQNSSNITRIFQQEVFFSAKKEDGIFYRPFLTLSYALDAQLFYGALWGFRLTSILIHACNTVLVFFFFKKLDYPRGISALFSFLFAVHPLTTQAVVWLPGRNDELLFFFFFLSFLLLIRYMSFPTWYWVALHILFFFLAVFTKETALVSPLIFLLYSYVMRGKRCVSQIDMMGMSGWVGVGMLFILLRYAYVPHATSYSMLDMVENMWLQIPAIWVYIGKTMYPIQLSVYPDLRDISYIPGFISCMVLILGIWICTKKDWRYVIFGATWLVIFILPTLLLREKYSGGILREHRMYLPIIGLFLLIGEIGYLRERKNSPLLSLIGGVLIGVLVAISVHHMSVYADAESFWTNAVKTSPHAAVSKVNLGAVYAQKKQWAEAERLYTDAIISRPDIMGGHNNLGVVYLNTGRIPEAKKEFEAELRFHPDFSMAKRNLALVKGP